SASRVRTTRPTDPFSTPWRPGVAGCATSGWARVPTSGWAATATEASARPGVGLGPRPGGAKGAGRHGPAWGRGPTLGRRPGLGPRPEGAKRPGNTVVPPCDAAFVPDGVDYDHSKRDPAPRAARGPGSPPGPEGGPASACGPM